MALQKAAVAIIGQGLAGTALAWQLRLRNVACVVIDRGERVTASRIAAGLMTPITGPRLNLQGGWQADWTAAAAFYRDVQQLTGQDFFFEQPAVRLHSAAAEVELLARRQLDPQFTALTTAVQPPFDERQIHAPWGGFQMTAGRLDCQRYLKTSRDAFSKDCMLVEAAINVNDRVVESNDGVLLPEAGLQCRIVVLCQGFVAASVSRTSHLKFLPAKGEILTLCIPEFEETRSLHHQGWLATAGTPNHFLTGATFEWKQLDCQPTTAARVELQERLARFLKLPVEVVDQQAAVRPTMSDTQPVADWLPGSTNIAVLNGLGTRGALTAPRLAARLADAIQLRLGEGEVQP